MTIRGPGQPIGTSVRRNGMTERTRPWRPRVAVSLALPALLVLTACGQHPAPPEETVDAGTLPVSQQDRRGVSIDDSTQPLFGAGWRLIGEGRDKGEAGTTAVATTDEQLEQVWREAGFSGDLPRVNWDTEVVVSFGAIWSSGREIRLTELVVQEDTVYPLTPTLEPDLGGPDDARPHSFVLAVERSALPKQFPFFVQLGKEPLGYGWPEERTVIEVDLSAPGSTATDEQMHEDPDLTPPIPTTVEEGDSIPVGEEVIYWFTPGECGWERLGIFDGQEWRLAEDSAPPDNLPPVEGDAWLTRLDEGQILYSIPETELIYVPAKDGWTCEDG